MAGLGWILRDNQDRVVDRGAIFEDHTTSPLMAEALAIREGLLQASNRAIRNFTLASDLQQLVTLINTNKFQLEVYGIIQDILKLVKDLNVIFIYVSRSENQEADLLAKSWV